MDRQAPHWLSPQPKLRLFKESSIAQRVEQGHIGIVDLDRPGLPVDMRVKCAMCVLRK